MYALTRGPTRLEKTGAVCPWGSARGTGQGDRREAGESSDLGRGQGMWEERISAAGLQGGAISAQRSLNPLHEHLELLGSRPPPPTSGLPPVASLVSATGHLGWRATLTTAPSTICQVIPTGSGFSEEPIRIGTLISLPYQRAELLISTEEAIAWK